MGSQAGRRIKTEILVALVQIVKKPQTHQMISTVSNTDAFQIFPTLMIPFGVWGAPLFVYDKGMMVAAPDVLAEGLTLNDSTGQRSVNKLPYNKLSYPPLHLPPCKNLLA